MASKIENGSGKIISESKWIRFDYTFRILQKNCTRMTHFGEISEFIEGDPVNLMILQFQPKNLDARSK